MLTEVHNMIPTDSTIVDHYIPGPKSYSIPLKIKGISNIPWAV